MATGEQQQGLSAKTRFALVIGIVALILPLIFFSGAFSATRISLTLFSNPDLERGLIGHWTFDGEQVQASTGGFDISTASFVDSFSVKAQATSPSDLAFSSDGTTMFVVGSNGASVHEYTLTTGFDVSTASFVDSLSVAAQETFPSDLAFNTDGTKMFVVGGVGDSVYEYSLTSGFDISTASFVDSFSVAAQELSPTGVAFDTDGTKMFVVGTNGDDVNEYILTTAFDVSTASFVDSFSVAAQEAFPSGLAFSTDGTTMFVVGSSGDSVYEYTLMAGFDVSTASFVDSFSVATQDTNPRGVAFSTDGTTMFVVGLVGDHVYEYQLGTPFSAEDRSPNQNSGIGSGGVTPAVGRLGQAIKFDRIDDYIDVGAVSSGVRTIAFWLKAATTTSNMNIIAIDGTRRIELDGSNNVVASGFPSATVHVDGSSASAHIADTGWHHVVITDTTGVNASNFDIGRVEGAGLFGGTLDDVRLYDRVLSADEINRLHGLGATTKINKTITANSELEDGLVGHWTFDGPHVTRSVDNVSTASFVDSFLVRAQESDPWGFAFSTDGTTMFVVGSVGDDVNEYTLTTAFDVSTASFVDSFSVKAQETIPSGLTFNTDGTKMFVVGPSGDSVYEYTLTTAFDVSTASFVDSFSVNAQETSPRDVAFSTDGTKMFVLGPSGDSVYEYTLTTAFDVSTASFVDSFSVKAQETSPGGLTFNTDGTKMFVVGVSGDSVYEYTLTTAFDVSTASFVDSFSVKAQETSPRDVAFSTDGTKMFVLGGSGDDVNEYVLSTSLTVEDWSASGNNGTGNGGVTPAIGRLGQALKFDGVDDYVSIPHISTPDELTYSFWINTSSSDTQNPLLSMRTLVRIIGSNQIQYFPDIDTTVVTASGFSLLDEWHHIAVTHDSSNNYVIYLDGVSELSGTTVDIDSGVVAGLGSRFGGYNSPGFVDGSMDDVRIYNRALSAEEVERLYELGATTRINRTLTANPELEDSLVGHWTFDGQDMKNGVEDRSGNDNTGTLAGFSSTTTRPGVLGQALDFDGSNDYVFVAGSSFGNNLDSFTLSLWAKFDALDTAHNLLYRVNGDTWYPRLFYTSWNESLNLQLRINGVTQNLATISLNSDQAQMWHHIVAIHDAETNQIYLYLNNAKGSVVDISNGTLDGGGNSLLIGHDPDLNYFMNGSLDDIRIYDRALSVEEVARLYELGR